jgi:hypothetical protein
LFVQCSPSQSLQAGAPIIGSFDGLHEPQWRSLIFKSTSQPSASPFLQSPKPSSQAHVPLLHTPCAPQLIPQPPQCWALVRVSVSQPSAVPPVQSAKFVLQA